MNYEIDDDQENLFVKELLDRYLAYWKLFVVAFCASFTIGFFYMRYTPKLYRVTSTILIKAEKDGSMSELSAFEDLSIFKNANREIENEVEILHSRPLIENVIKKLHLNVQYFSKTKYSKRLVELTNEIPIRVHFLDSSYYDNSFKFVINVLPDRTLLLKNGEEKILKKFSFDQCISSPFGDILITPNHAVLSKYIEKDIYINSTSLLDVTERYKSAIKVGLTNPNTSVVTLSMTTIAQEKAAKILNQLIQEYNRDVINDKNQISTNTAKFIKDRLNIINAELDSLEKNVESYKSSNNLTDISSEASLMLSDAANNDRKIVEITTQLELSNFLLEHLKNTENELLPVNLGFADLSAGQAIDNYNMLALERNRLRKSSGQENPLLLLLNEKLADMRLSLQKSLENLRKSLQLKNKNLRQRDDLVDSNIASLPQKERKLRDIQRQQQIKETLFLYLLEKREETAISLATTVSQVKVIEKAYATRSPVKPKKNMVLLTCFLGGLIIPVVFVFFIDLMDTKIRNAKELKKYLKLPLIGSIPASEDKELVTHKADRSILAEAFRLIETNLDFLLAYSRKKGKTILITSSIKGEGKSFVASNLGVTLGRSGKKVALLEMDLRSAQLKKRMAIRGQKGITDFITDEHVTIGEIASNMDGFKNLDVFTSGPKPPNPAELLKHPRVEILFETLKKEYDFIIIDTPPITVVADTLLLSSYSDLCIYVIRQKYTDKRMLDIPRSLVQEKRFAAFSILLNAVSFSKGYGYGYGESKNNTSILRKLSHKITI
ncbi:GumC family protein [Aquimarina pacifica]|uniref:GumC family protein n=1 Tax=Aquimarina pacifica TaxID=1296415 RepID=UPI00046F9F4F|nr:polysaccharide biosynthesis tyrosine autokinase [Aquimarina pacifica]